LKKQIQYQQFLQVKQHLQDSFLHIIKTPQFYTNLIYFTWHYNLPKNFVFNYFQKLRSLTYSDFKKMQYPDLLDSAAYIMVGSRQKNACKLLELARNFNINIYDRNIYKYDVMQKGFDAWTVINRYLLLNAPHKPLRNLTLEFDGMFFSDSTFLHLTGYVLRKWPNYYRFQTFVIHGSDTLFHYLSLFDGKNWYDSSAVGRVPSDSLAWKKTDFFTEQFYKQLGYRVKLLCEPSLFVQNIYKIRVTTPSGYRWYDFYDNSQGIKLYTQFFAVENEKNWLQTIFYFDYQRIEQGKWSMRVPFVIKQQTPDFTLELHLKRVNMRKLPTSYFSPNPKPPKNPLILDYLW
jgi:hypothetical protein